MNVLIDATGIAKEKAGVGVYAKNLLECLTRTPGTVQIFILAQDDDPEMDFGNRPAVTMIWVPARLFRVLPLRFLLEQIYVPALVLMRRIHVLLCLDFALPLLCLKARRVVSFDYMTFFTMPYVH